MCSRLYSWQVVKQALDPNWVALVEATPALDSLSHTLVLFPVGIWLCTKSVLNLDIMSMKFI